MRGQQKPEPAIDSAVAVENAAGGGRFLILCDHASNRLPPEYGTLGLSEADLKAHIAWDPGALGVSHRLSEYLDAPLVYSTVSRLVIDCNRALDAPGLIAEMSETTAIPGNAELPEAERRRRLAAVHVPYHDAVDALVERRIAARLETALVAVHSFTPILRGMRRPWDVGVLYDRDRRLADNLIAAFDAEGLKVGVNEPYRPADGVYYTLERHGGRRGLATVMIEIRNDLLTSDDRQEEWATRIARALGAADAPVRAA